MDGAACLHQGRAMMASCRSCSKRYRSRSARRPKSVHHSAPLPTADEEVAGLPQIQVGMRFGAGTHMSNTAEESTTTPITVYDGRADSQRFKLEQHGFQLVSTHGLGIDETSGSLVDFFDADEFVQKVFPQVEREVLQLISGATRVIAFDHIVRDPSRVAEELSNTDSQVPRTRFLQGTLGNAHGDYTARSGRSRAEQLLAPFEDASTIQKALSDRFAMINVWVPLETVRTSPLALCTWSSVSPKDVLTNRLHFKHRIGETYKVKFSPNQRWVFFSEASPTEAIVFKTYDSSSEASRFCLHSAFRLPEEEMGQTCLPTRRSVEVRLLVLWGEDLEQLACNFVPPHMTGVSATELVKEVPYTETLSFGDEW
mmetsp:Transcript_99715/g.157834  ORF Transcript_99715/g.157834 Transcript_99715/m.157834 type:complete len:370 (+) Transcript_99715:70-1179(+)|eukprot:CAMPEP_0169092862 /NCGR_PEP_ID=MMETSP1015-20121227/17130_1 /TAXON_ID=342587 /ORGANISM="Karlodinium micrum, Strain CCMP2283" /LENGTH=369 /DNA_ID=CAMNT_0009153465 /DNA_START=63 /DNA_END=1169 /DNA_ORIENTATION=-